MSKKSNVFSMIHQTWNTRWTNGRLW